MRKNSKGLPARVNIALSTKMAAQLMTLQEKTDVSSNAEVIRNAIRLYGALIEEVEKGNELLIRRPNGEIVSYVYFLSSTTHKLNVIP